MVSVPAEKGRRIRLGVCRILAVYWPPGVLQEAIHFRQVGRGRAIRPREEGDRRGVGLVLEPPLHRSLVGGLGLLQPGAPFL